MLRIGYIAEQDSDAEAGARLRQAGCYVVQAEAACGEGATPALDKILHAMRPGDELVTPNLRHLGRTPRTILRVLNELDRRRAVLALLEPNLTSHGLGSAALRAALEAAADLEPPAPPRRGRSLTPQILALEQAGVAPNEIARRLKVSRNTVWRHRKAAAAVATAAE